MANQRETTTQTHTHTVPYEIDFILRMENLTKKLKIVWIIPKKNVRLNC